jgi:hypothetical protein
LGAGGINKFGAPKQADPSGINLLEDADFLAFLAERGVSYDIHHLYIGDVYIIRAGYPHFFVTVAGTPYTSMGCMTVISPGKVRACQAGAK